MTNKVDCDKCQGTGTADFRGFGIDTCRWCDGKGTVDLKVLTVKNCLTVEMQDRLENLRQWVEDDCPEGVSGMTEDVSWLLSYVEDLASAGLRAQAEMIDEGER